MPDDRVTRGSRSSASHASHQDDVRPVLPMLPLGGEAFTPPLSAATADRAATRRRQAALLLVTGTAFVSCAAVAIALVVRADRSAREQAPPAGPRFAAAPTWAVPPPAVPAISERPVAAPIEPRARRAGAIATAAYASAAGSATAADTRTPPAPVQAERSSRSTLPVEPPHERAARASSVTRDVRREERVARSAPPLPLQPNRSQVIAAMQRVAPAVSACFGRRHGSAKVLLTVLGKTGRVTTARVTGQRGKVGSCIARAVRRARLPKFQQRKLEISYPLVH